MGGWAVGGEGLGLLQRRYELHDGLIGMCYHEDEVRQGLDPHGFSSSFFLCGLVFFHALFSYPKNIGSLFQPDLIPFV